MHERAAHELECVHPHRSGAEVMDALQQLDQQLVDERKLFSTIFELLGYEKIIFNGKIHFPDFDFFLFKVLELVLLPF